MFGISDYMQASSEESRPLVARVWCAVSGEPGRRLMAASCATRSFLVDSNRHCKQTRLRFGRYCARTLTHTHLPLMLHNSGPGRGRLSAVGSWPGTRAILEQPEHTPSSPLDTCCIISNWVHALKSLSRGASNTRQAARRLTSSGMCLSLFLSLAL